jgi:hypothetical protein
MGIKISFKPLSNKQGLPGFQKPILPKSVMLSGRRVALFAVLYCHAVWFSVGV